MKDGFVRIACATPKVRVADCQANAQAIAALAREAAQADASIAVFPQLCVTAYTCGDLFLQSTLLEAAECALAHIAEQTCGLNLLIIVGLPVRNGAALYNCGAVLYRGKLLGIVPKRHLPNHGEFQELRYFTPGPEEPFDKALIGQRAPMGMGLLFVCEDLPALRLGVELGEDLWAPIAPSTALALSGATVLVNLAASHELVGKAEERRRLIPAHAARLTAAYAYANAGLGESTTDLVFSGHSLITEGSTLLAESSLFSIGLIFADVDLQRLEAERRRTSLFPPASVALREIPFQLPLKETTLCRAVDRTPFVPTDEAARAAHCAKTLSLQAQGLATRLSASNTQGAVLALSGGLDSTLALIVTARAFDLLNLPRARILAVTMPGFGTTTRTRGNADALAEAYGATLKSIPIHKAVSQHFEDIGHDPSVTDVTYENAQARERTQIVMDLANSWGGLMVGTGDLSELALGWTTYGGDHMSMYNVNASIPKTLLLHLVLFEAEQSPPALGAVLRDILATPVSPELLPPKDNQIVQKTEDLVGPYLLHDFYLYYLLRFGFTPEKLHRLARHAFADQYTPTELKHWLLVFLRRFIAQQYKRSCMPDGPKTGPVSLSPRGDLRLPSDASAAEWLRRAEGIAL